MQQKTTYLFKCLIFLFGFGFPFLAFAQKPDTLIKKLDSLHLKADSAGKQLNNTEPEAYNESTKLTVPAYVTLIVSDIKQAFTKPFHIKKKEWVKIGGFIALETALSFADETIQTNALTFRNNSKPVRDINSFVTNFGGSYEVYTLVALGTYGYVFKKTKLVTTTFLATQAYITAAAVQGVVKLITGRQRPDFYEPGTLEVDPAFRGPFYQGKDVYGNQLNSSFPSGHTTAAFAAATVFAMEYKDKRLVPILSYTAATIIGLTRIVENRHWFSDVVAGAALGFLTGRQVVNNYHRYAKLKAPEQKKNTVVFNLYSHFGRLMPGIIYRFHS
ncbi:MAG: phosphatase family protein [Chitinophagaceae bacterium]|nr:phosphatase family protein [Chitinophagaceae bacterium]